MTKKGWFLILFFIGFYANSQNTSSNFRTKKFIVSKDTIKFDSVPINPQNFKEQLKDKLKSIKKLINYSIDIALPFLCLGIVVQLMVGTPLFGWSPVANIIKASAQLGDNSFIGVITLIVLYSLLNKK